MNKTIARGFAVLALGTALASFASANFMQIRITDITNSLNLTVVDGGVGDIDASTNEIVIDPTLLTSTFISFDIRSQITASSNIATGDDYRYLSTEARIRMKAGAAQDLFEIEASQTDFLTPGTPTQNIDSSYSGVLTNTAAGDGTDFAGGVDNTNTLFGITNTGGILGPYFSTGKKPQSFAFDAPTVSFAGGNAYAITNEQAYNLSGGGIAQSSGITTVTGVVPEPASMTALGLGVVALIRRRRNK